MFTKITPKTVALVINWLWNGVIAGLLLHLGAELTIEQAIIIIAALICTTVVTFVWHDDRPDISAEILNDAEGYLTELLGEDEDIRAVIKTMFTLTKKVTDVQRGRVSE